MKKVLFCIFTLFASVNLFAQQQLNLSEVITRSARAVEEVLPQNSKVAVLNFASSSETFSDYVIEELTGELVNGKKLTIVDRRNLALISQEMNLQLSGDVSDESAQAIGKKLGAQSIISGTLTNMGTFHRFRIRVINVETAAIQTQISLDLKNDAQVAFLLSGSPTSPQPVPSSETTPSTSTNDVSTPLTEGTMVPGNSLTEKLAWLNRNADSHNTYILAVSANENIAPYTFEYSGAIDITVVLRGDSQNRTIRLRSNDTMFTVKSNITLILENNITLQGHRRDKGAMVSVQDGGMFIMNSGATITGNTTTASDLYGTGVWVGTRGTFTMNGGTISGNTVSFGGGGVALWGTFTMNGGTISGNTAQWGGGVFVGKGGTFTMTGGTIIENTALRSGGGMQINGTFTMRGGTITGNTAREGYGGGVSLDPQSTFTKTGGIITGYNSDRNNGNAVKDGDGILARRGHAVQVNDNIRKETTAGSGVNMSYSNGKASGGWDN